MYYAACALTAAYFVMGALGYALFGIDKSRARKGMWRISERTLIIAAICMGGAGALLGMYHFRHKTQKHLFRLLIPALSAVQTGMVAWLWGRL